MATIFLRKTNSRFGYRSLAIKNKLVIASAFFILSCLGFLCVTFILMMEDRFGFYGIGHYMMLRPMLVRDAAFRALFVTSYIVFIYLVVCYFGYKSASFIVRRLKLLSTEEEWDALIFLRFPERFCAEIKFELMIKDDAPWFGSFYKTVVYIYFILFFIGAALPA